MRPPSKIIPTSIPKRRWFASGRIVRIEPTSDGPAAEPGYTEPACRVRDEGYDLDCVSQRCVTPNDTFDGRDAHEHAERSDIAAGVRSGVDVTSDNDGRASGDRPLKSADEIAGGIAPGRQAGLLHSTEDECLGLGLLGAEDAPRQVPRVGADPGEAFDMVDDRLGHAHDIAPMVTMTNSVGMMALRTMT
ncbi:hypothetical protein [Methylorubrum sp. SB2]|uniref:hypothetical protein n=1 Tax=Methylorubrum subtropicum TaxID=3138812 RepID=UPI00313F03F9